MDFPFLFYLEAWHISIVILLLMMFAYLAGKSFRKKFFDNGEQKSNALVMLETSVFGLLGLMLAFTYNAAGGRFDNHRKIIVEESNAIGTASLRSDLYPDSERDGFKIDFRKYLELRIEYYSVALNEVKSSQNKAATDSAAASLWNRATRLSKQPELIYATQQMIPALNSMFDIASMRDFEYKALIPSATVVLVILLSLACSFIVGYNSDRSSKADKVLLICFIILTTIVIYLILDLNRPLRGLIDSSVGQEKLIELRSMFK